MRIYVHICSYVANMENMEGFIAAQAYNMQLASMYHLQGNSVDARRCGKGPWMSLAYCRALSSGQASVLSSKRRGDCHVNPWSLGGTVVMQWHHRLSANMRGACLQVSRTYYIL